MGTLKHHYAKVSEPSELQFGVVHRVNQGIGVLDGSPRPARGMGGFWGLCSSIFTIGKSNGVVATASSAVNSSKSRRVPALASCAG